MHHMQPIPLPFLNSPKALLLSHHRIMMMRKRRMRMMMKTQGWEMKAMTAMKELVVLMAMMDMKQMMLR